MPIPIQRVSIPLAHTDCVNASGVIVKGPCVVWSLILTGIGGDCYAKVYDGFDTSGELKFVLNSADNRTSPVALSTPTDFDRGVYVELENTNGYLSVQHAPSNPYFYPT